MPTLRNEGARVSGDVNTKTECGIYLEMPLLNSEAGKVCRGGGVDLKAESSMHLYS